jgi:hypothetical protein
MSRGPPATLARVESSISWLLLHVDRPDVVVGAELSTVSMAVYIE